MQYCFPKNNKKMRENVWELLGKLLKPMSDGHFLCALPWRVQQRLVWESGPGVSKRATRLDEGVLAVGQECETFFESIGMRLSVLCLQSEQTIILRVEWLFPEWKLRMCL